MTFEVPPVLPANFRDAADDESHAHKPRSRRTPPCGAPRGGSEDSPRERRLPVLRHRRRHHRAEIVWSDDSLLAFRDRFPVSPGHTLIVPRRHFPTWFDATADEQRALLRAVEFTAHVLPPLRRAHKVDIVAAFTQQLGRGLRAADDKRSVSVIEFVGNHKIFLERIRTPRPPAPYSPTPPRPSASRACAPAVTAATCSSSSTLPSSPRRRPAPQRPAPQRPAETAYVLARTDGAWRYIGVARWRDDAWRLPVDVD